MKSNSQQSISAIILTYNEELHLERCITSLTPFCKEIWVVDSFSTDRTLEIARRYGARTVQHRFVYQAQQFNWALDHLDLSGTWIWRVDADEYVSPMLGERVNKAIQECDNDMNGIIVNKSIVFMGRKLKHGGWYPAPQIKVIRKGFGRSEDKLMDEHLVVTGGGTFYVDGDQIDENLHDLTWWTSKHNQYATREAMNMLWMYYGLDLQEDGVRPRFLGSDAERKRWLKCKYIKLPLFLRPLLFFLYRYIFLLGFLDGKAGLVWHTLQGFWYRFLVDAKVFDLQRRMNFNDAKMREWLLKKKEQVTLF